MGAYGDLIVKISGAFLIPPWSWRNVPRTKNQGASALYHLCGRCTVAPSDLSAGTKGLKCSFSKFNNVEINLSHPRMLWILQEWIALVLSFGGRTLRHCFLVTMVLTAPLKAILSYPHTPTPANCGGFYSNQKGD